MDYRRGKNPAQVVFFLLPSFRAEEGNPGIWAVHTARLAAPWVFTSHGLPCSYLIHVYTGTTCVHNTMRQCIGSYPVPTEYTEWQRPLIGIYSIMMEKVAQAGEGRGARPSPFCSSTITNKVMLYAPAERADTLPLFLLYPSMYSVPMFIPQTRE
jgi:hypothetical protein